MSERRYRRMRFADLLEEFVSELIEQQVPDARGHAQSAGPDFHRLRAEIERRALMLLPPDLD